MTQQRRDNNSTELGLFTRGQLPEQQTDVSEIDSEKGFVTTDIDYIWRNRYTGKWMLLEEKRYKDKYYDLSKNKYSQYQTFYFLHKRINDEDYQGYYLLKFEKTGPEDRAIWIEKLFTPKRQIVEISAKQLVQFKRTMQMPEEDMDEIDEHINNIRE